MYHACTNQTCSIPVTPTVNAGSIQWTTESSLSKYYLLCYYCMQRNTTTSNFAFKFPGEIAGTSKLEMQGMSLTMGKLCHWWWCHYWLPSVGLDGLLVWLQRTFSLLRRFCIFLRYKVAHVTVVCYFYAMVLQTESCEKNTAV